MQTAPMPPTGRRKVSPAQLHWQMAAASSPGLPATTPGRVLAAFKRAEPALGVPAKVVKLVDYLVGRTREMDWDGTGLGPLAWPSDDELEDRLGVGRSQCKQIVRAALECGYVRLRRSPNGKRYGSRDKSGRIIQAYGFDLSPLAERMDEFMRKTAEWEARRAEGKQLRREIGSLHGAIHSLVELALTESAKGHDWSRLVAQANALLDQRGRERDPAFLWPIVARLRALHVRLREAVAAALMKSVNHKEFGPTGPKYRPHNTTTNQLKIVKTIAGHAQKVGQEEKSRNATYPPADAKGNRVGDNGTEIAAQAREAGDSSALRGFTPTPWFVLAIAPAFTTAGCSSSATWSDLSSAALEVCHGLGVSKHAWGQAYVMLGQQPAVMALASIAARHARGLVQSPGGLLRRMVELHEAGSLRLDRTLFGLADELARQRSSEQKAEAEK